MSGARRILVVVALAAMSLAAGAVLRPSDAAPQTVTSSAPYTAATHSTASTCRAAEPAATCVANATAEATSGRMTLSSSIDSGLGGRLPASASSSNANGGVQLDVGFGDAQQLTATFHARVSNLAVSHVGDGVARIVAWGQATCDGCATSATTIVPTRDGDVSLAVTLHRGQSTAAVAHLVLGSAAESRLDCHDFCIRTTGTAHAAATVVLVGVDLSFA